MKLIPLTKGYSAMVDDADFEWLNQWKWHASAGQNTMYASRRIKGDGANRAVVLMHRQILGLTDPKVLGEHADGNGLNNQRGNIRPCSRSQNMMNRGSVKGSRSRYKGVSWNKPLKKWDAGITANGRGRHIGCFDNEEDAARAYNQLAKSLHGEFAKYNDVSPLFPEPEWKPQVLWPTNTSGFRGVCFDKRTGRWLVSITCCGKQMYIGRFTDTTSAAKAYDKAAIEMHGENARLNFPKQNPI